MLPFEAVSTAPGEPERNEARLRRLTIDLTPLRVSRDFRLIWLGLLVTSTGSQFTLVAVFVQVTKLTGSEAAVGATGLAYLLGLVAGTLAGGAILDAWDRRRLLMVAQVGLAVGLVDPPRRRDRGPAAALADLRGPRRPRREQLDRRPHPIRDRRRGSSSPHSCRRRRP